jgi:hypothetical protein
VREQRLKKGRLTAIAISIGGAIAVVATVIGNLTTVVDDIPKLWHALFGSAPTAESQTTGPRAETSKKIATTSNNTMTVEFLQTRIDQSHAEWLAGLACRNLDRIVHLDISVDWPDQSLDVETTGDRRLILWNSTDEFLFPKGSYYMLHGSYIIRGYFIARSGGVHQGVVSNAFEKVDDAQVMLRPGLVENKMTSDRCKP